MLSSVPLRLGESVQPGRCVYAPAGVVLSFRSIPGSRCSGSAGSSRADQVLPTLSSRDHRELGGPILDAVTSQVQDLPDVSDTSTAALSSSSANRGRGHQVDRCLVSPFARAGRQQRARWSRGVAARIPSQGSCRGRRRGEGQCCVFGLRVADWPVGVCGGLSPGPVRWYRRPGRAGDLHPVSGGCHRRQGVQGWRRR
jgi:hypothetical protein